MIHSQDFKCPKCEAEPGSKCVYAGRYRGSHPARLKLSKAENQKADRADRERTEAVYRERRKEWPDGDPKGRRWIRHHPKGRPPCWRMWSEEGQQPWFEAEVREQAESGRFRWEVSWCNDGEYDVGYARTLVKAQAAADRAMDRAMAEAEERLAEFRRREARGNEHDEWDAATWEEDFDV